MKKKHIRVICVVLAILLAIGLITPVISIV